MVGQPIVGRISPPAGVLYHYTTRALAQEICMGGMIRQNSQGLVYLTDVLFKLGWQATDYLALPEKNAEAVVPIPIGWLDQRLLEYRGMVPEVQGTSGRSLRRGGGHQWVVHGAIRIVILPWSWVELEVP